jgi:hypothetical protein
MVASESNGSRKTPLLAKTHFTRLTRFDTPNRKSQFAIAAVIRAGWLSSD